MSHMFTFFIWIVLILPASLEAVGGDSRESSSDVDMVGHIEGTNAIINGVV